ncbi:MAG: hypothetical protein O2967_03400 [Proteobacteria bacterium]|nr:hypothetical protein [Pseudomonadota bacterium]
MDNDGQASDLPGRGAPKRRRTSRRRAQLDRLQLGSDAGPTNWRMQHHPLGENHPALVRTEVTGQDGRGPRIYAMRAPDTIDALVNKGRIDHRAEAAARKFEGIFQGASLHGLANRDVRVLPGGFDPGNAAPHRILSAREDVWRAMRALGGIGTPGANIVWDVLGLGMTIKAHAERCQFGGGRSLNPMTATGILVQSCFTLAAHYGT